MTISHLDRNFSKCLLGSVLALVLGCSPGLVFAEPSSSTYKLSDQKKRLSLSDAYAIALRNSSDVTQKQRDIERARILYQIDREKYASDVKLTSSLVNRQKGDITGGGGEDPITRIFFELKWTFPWWRKEGVKIDATKSELAIAIALEERQAFEKDLQFNLLSAYLEVLLQQKKIEMGLNALDLIQARETSVSEAFALGDSSRLSLLIEKNQLLEQVEYVEELKTDLAEKRGDLFVLLGDRDRKQPLQSEYFSFYPVDVADFDLDRATEVQLRVARLEIARQMHEVDKHKNVWKPSFGAMALYSPASNGAGADRLEEVRNVGVFVELPFPSFDREDQEMNLANHDLLVLREDMQAQYDEVKNRFNELLDKVQLQSSRLALLDELVKEKQKEVDASRKSFELGKMTRLELKLMESNVDNTSKKYMDLLLDYLVSVAELKVLQGDTVITGHDNLKMRPE